MLLHRFHTELQLMGHCFIGQPACHKLHHLSLPTGQTAKHLRSFTLLITKPLNGLIGTIPMQAAVDAAWTLKFREISCS
jgi:hypothetical protein